MVVSKRRQQKIKLNTAKPVIKKVDIEKIKEEFAANAKGSAEKKETKAKAKTAEVESKAEESPKDEAPTEETTPKAEEKKEDKE